MTSSQSYTPRPTTSEPGIISPYPVIWARPISLSCSDFVLQYIITSGKLSEWPLLHAIRWEMGVAIVAGWDHRLEPNAISINMAITSCERRRQWCLSWLYHIIEHGGFISAVKSIHGSYGIPTALNGQHAWWSSENRSLIEGIFMEVTTRAQYFKQTSLSPVWRLYLPVSYVTMLKLHSAECIHDEVV